MAKFEDGTSVATLRQAQQWVSSRLPDTGYNIARIVTTKAATDTGQPVPRATAEAFGQRDYFAVYLFSEEKQQVNFVGFWRFDSLKLDPRKTYPFINLWNNKRLASLPVKRAKCEAKVEAQLEPVLKPVPTIEHVPRYFDLELECEVTLRDFEDAIRRRITAYRPTNDPDIEFMKLSTPSAILHNQLSVTIARMAPDIPRDLWVIQEQRLLKQRLMGCTKAVKLRLFQALLPESRKVIGLRNPQLGVNYRGILDSRGREVSIFAADDAGSVLINEQLAAFVQECKEPPTFIEVPFEQVPRRAMKQHDALLFAGQAFVPDSYLNALIHQQYRRNLLAYPAAGLAVDKRMRKLVTLWTGLFKRSFPVPGGLSGEMDSLEQLLKPQCVSATLTQYPDVTNRKFLVNYMARLGQPIKLMFGALAVPIAKKYGSDAKAQQRVVERGMTTWYAASKLKDFHTCHNLMENLRCPFFKQGVSPADALQQCWGNLQVQGQKTPMEFTRTRHKLVVAMEQS